MRGRVLIFTIVSFVLAQLLFAQSTPNIALNVKQLMTAAQFQQCGLQKLSDEELKSLNGWLTGFTIKVLTAKEGSATPSPTSFADLEGAIIIADDGQFLGKITTNSVDSNSLMNEVGRYGSEVSSTSIFNEVSRYGSTVSSLSPFNSVSSTPPKVFKGEKFIGYLTVNTIKTPRIDPYALIGWLKSQQ